MGKRWNGTKMSHCRPEKAKTRPTKEALRMEQEKRIAQRRENKSLVVTRKNKPKMHGN